MIPQRHRISESRKTRLKDRKPRDDDTWERNQRAEMPMPDTGSIDLMRQDKYSIRSMLTTSGGKAGDRDTTGKVTASSPYRLVGSALITPRLGVSLVSPVHA